MGNLTFRQIMYEIERLSAHYDEGAYVYDIEHCVSLYDGKTRTLVTVDNDPDFCAYLQENLRWTFTEYDMEVQPLG